VDAVSVNLVVAVLYAIAAVFCWTLPSNPPGDEQREPLSAAVSEAEHGTFGQFREGIDYIRGNRAISWSLVYLGIAASVVGVIGVLGPKFAQQTLGLAPKDLVVLVLPLGIGVVMGVLFLNNYGRYIPRRRAIEGGLIALGILLVLVTIAGPISRFLSGVAADAPLLDLSSVTSLVSVVVALALLAGVSYGFVAIGSQTQLQEDVPEEVRGRVFGVLNMLVSVASFLPIIIVGTISDFVGTTAVILLVALAILIAGIVSIVTRGPLRPGESMATAGDMVGGEAVDPIGVAVRTDRRPGPDGRVVRPDDRASPGDHLASPDDPPAPPPPSGG
jgi:MFS-type transporter involved in bile tolerance (Atg22 family)